MSKNKSKETKESKMDLWKPKLNEFIESILDESLKIHSITDEENKLTIEIVDKKDSSSFLKLVFDFNSDNDGNYFSKNDDFIFYYVFDEGAEHSEMQTEFIHNLKNKIEDNSSLI